MPRQKVQRLMPLKSRNLFDNIIFESKVFNKTVYTSDDEIPIDSEVTQSSVGYEYIKELLEDIIEEILNTERSLKICIKEKARKIDNAQNAPSTTDEIFEDSLLTNQAIGKGHEITTSNVDEDTAADLSGITEQNNESFRSSKGKTLDESDDLEEFECIPCTKKHALDNVMVVCKDITEIPSNIKMENNALKTEYHDDNIDEVIVDEEEKTGELDLPIGLEIEEQNLKDLDEISIRDCGEPMRAKFLQLDFNPIQGKDDNEFVINKCAEFWKFIDMHPELKPFKVEPEVNDYGHDVDNSNNTSVGSTPSDSGIREQQGLTPITKIALKWLQKDVMNDSLATKPEPREQCEPISRAFADYSLKDGNEDWVVGKRREQELKPHRFSVMGHSSVTQPSKPKPLDDLAHLMSEMDAWDLKNPKSMHATQSESYMTQPPDEKISILPYINNEDKYCEKCLN